MKKLQLLVMSIFLILFAQNVFAQYTPKKGTRIRKVIINALRIPVKRELKKPVIFGDVQLRVKGNWAIIDTALPLKPNGKPFNYRGSVSEYAKCINRGGDDCGDPQYSAILRKRGEKWRVLKFGSGATDVWIGYACSKIRGCPKEFQ
jgi:hypothetical protein